MDKPIARALVLEAALAHDGDIKDVDAAQWGEYVSTTGRACFMRPDTDPPGLGRDVLHRAWCLQEQDDRLVSLEQERALQEWDSKREYDQGREYWLLVLQAEDGRLIAASVVDASWFSINTMSSNLRDHNPTFIFGTLEKWVEEIPLISPIVIMLESPVR